MDEADRAEALTRSEMERHLLKIRGEVGERRGTTICIDCGRAIPPERIAVYPGARRCLACQEGIEG